MAIITVNKKQTLFDLCLQVYGTIEKLFDFAKENNIKPDSIVNIGEVLKYETSNGNDKQITNKAINNKIAFVNPSGISAQSLENVWTDGIGTPFSDGNGLVFTFETE